MKGPRISNFEFRISNFEFRIPPHHKSVNSEIRNSESAIRNSRWWLLTLTVTRDAEEPAGAALFDLGSTGLVTLDESEDTVTVGAYFDQSVDPDHLKRALGASFGAPALRDAITKVSIELVPDQDWMQKWKEGFEPFAIGERLLVAPSWKLPRDSGGRVVIQIDPGMAFGTGTHETTRLCLEAIERYWRGGSLLDVGTGTGILAIAAAKLEPGSQVVAIDVDPQAVQVARENASINSVSESIEFKEARPGDLAGRRFDLVVANLTAEVIIETATGLAGCLSAPGVMILSGILTQFEGDVGRALSASGLSVSQRREAGEWCALIARRTDRAATPGLEAGN
jgi:ribosomal protein L11 methyltransferase